MVSEKEILAELKKVVDPEIGINVVDLGLIYEIKVKGNEAKIKMTLTNPFCPIQSYLKQSVENAISNMPGLKHVAVELVFDPPWTPERMSAEAKKALGMA